jgi:hypothetical protein
MAQTRKMSLVEALASNAIAFIISIFTNFLILPLFGMHPNMWQSIGMVAVFTMISIVRGYYVRRLFEWWAALSVELGTLRELT